MTKSSDAKGNPENLLCFIPEKKHIDFESKNGKVFLIFKHTNPAEKLLQWLFKRPAITDIELDSIGSKAWQYMDGINTVCDIGRLLEAEFGDKCQPVYKRLALFIKYTSDQGWIKLKKQEAAEKEKSS